MSADSLREAIIAQYSLVQDLRRAYPQAIAWSTALEANSPPKGFAECIANGIYDELGTAVWQDPVISRFDPTAALPAGPSDRDRYISTATANGWTSGYIYEWFDDSAVWRETVPTEGFIARVLTEDQWYTFDGSGWWVFNDNRSAGIISMPVIANPSGLSITWGAGVLFAGVGGLIGWAAMTPQSPLANNPGWFRTWRLAAVSNLPRWSCGRPAAASQRGARLPVQARSAGAAAGL